MSEPSNESVPAQPKRRLFTTRTGHGYEDYFVFLIFWILAVIVFSQFFTRYVLNNSLAWTEEVARFFLVAVTFLGIPIGIRKGSHILVGAFCYALPPKWERAVAIAVNLACLAFYTYGTYLAYLVTKLVKNQQISSFEISKSVLYVVVCAGFVLMVFRCAETVWTLLRSPIDAR